MVSMQVLPSGFKWGCSYILCSVVIFVICIIYNDTSGDGTYDEIHQEDLPVGYKLRGDHPAGNDERDGMAGNRYAGSVGGR